jgi:choline dehydrogenase
MFRITEGITPQSDEEMIELLRRDINRADAERYEHATLFQVPLAVDATYGRRSSIARFINSIVDAGFPLTVSLHSLASKIIFEEGEDGSQPKAIGVEYMVGEGLYAADSRYNDSQTFDVRSVYGKEIIVSGGAFNTPQILKLSGIGAREELEALGIDVLVDLPAVVSRPSLLPINTSKLIYPKGNYMQDNYESPVHVVGQQPWPDPSLPPSPCTGTFNESDPCFMQWQLNGTGAYGESGGPFFMTSRSTLSWDNDTDLAYISIPNYNANGFFPGYSTSIVENSTPYDWSSSILKGQTANPSGTVTLRSTDPRQAPAINFNFFAQNTDHDLAALIEGVELLLRGYDEVGIPYEVVNPDPLIDMAQGLMDEAFSHHATSSCRIGPLGARDACVDSRFRVQGVDNLRVVDASVFPRVPGIMPNAPTFTISMKAFRLLQNGE